MASDLPPFFMDKISRLEANDARHDAAISALQTSMETLSRDIRDIRCEITDGANRMATGLDDVKRSLTTVITKTLNAAPPWASTLLLILATVIGGMASAFGILIHR